MEAISTKHDSIRRYVIKRLHSAFYYVKNKFIDVSTECAVFMFRVNVELIVEQKNDNWVG